MSPITIERAGIFLSKPISLLIVLIYLAQSGLLVYLMIDRYQLEQVIDYQRSRIYELEEKLKIFKVIEDFQIGYSENEKGELAKVIFEESNRYDYDPFLVMAVILAESGFRKGQISPKGAVGAMQVMPSTGHWLAMKSGMKWHETMDLMDPVINVRLGMLHLFEQITKYRDIKKGLVAYNMGQSKLNERLRSQKSLPRQYLLKIWDNYRMLKSSYDT